MPARVAGVGFVLAPDFSRTALRHLHLARLEDVIAENLDEVFPGCEVLAAAGVGTLLLAALMVRPIGVAAHLAPYLPNHPLVPEAGPETGIGPVAAAPWGSAGVLAISCGKEWYSRPQIIMARFCSTMDTPIAVISGARRGAWRSGR